MKRFVILFAVLLLVALGVFFARNSIRQTLSDWTGEEDLEWQIKGLYYLANRICNRRMTPPISRR